MVPRGSGIERSSLVPGPGPGTWAQARAQALAHLGPMGPGPFGPGSGPGPWAQALAHVGVRKNGGCQTIVKKIKFSE